jgi:hypothetical protein
MDRKVVPFVERRRSTRIEVEIPVEIEREGRRIPARTKNISILGGYILTDTFVPPGETVGIHFRVNPPLTVTGKVIWLDGEGEKICGIGVGFSTMKDPERKALEELLSRFSPTVPSPR